ncbi:MAG: flavodoxin family protein [Spirochaetes bacterium]|nr:flavodoxin family protein [Spirochaetota bacterium]
MPVSGKTDIRVLALFASPRKTGASSTIHESFISGLGTASVRRVHLYDLDIRPCTACGHCVSRRECVFTDDMTPMYDALDEAHLLSISMPLYFSAPPGPLKLFIDRTQVLWERARRGERRPINTGTGVLICTGGARYRNMFHPSVTIIRHFFNSSGFEYNRRNFLLYADMEGLIGSTIPGKYLSRARNYGAACRERLERQIRGAHL